MKRLKGAAGLLAFGCLVWWSSLAAAPASEYPATEVERPILIAPQMFEFDLQASSLSTRQAFDAEGKVVDTDGAYDLLTAELLLRYGITARWEVNLVVPYITGRIGETSGGSLGDLRAGTRAALILTEAFDLTIGFELSFPSGEASYHYERLGDNLQLQNFRTGDPGYNFYPELELRFRGPRLSLRFRAVGIFTTEEEVLFSTIGGFDETLPVDPGDGYRLTAGGYYQIMDSLAAGLFLNHLSLSETRVDGEGLDDHTMLLELEPRLLFQFGPDLDLGLGIGIPLAGENAPLAYPVLVEIKSRF